MIIQITRTRNELFLLKEMLPIWKRYADGFVFLDDRSDDGTYEYLMENKEKFNILSILKNDLDDGDLSIESNERQMLFDEAYKYSGNIICLDSDEYLDGIVSKDELENFLENNKNTLFNIRWVQYVDSDKIRVDGPWKQNIKDRIGSYGTRAIFRSAQMHSEHLPNPGNIRYIPDNFIFIAHLQWLDKKTVAVKQYFWKITDYVNKLKFNADVVSPKAYDASVNNFNWTIEPYSVELKVDPNIYNKQDIENSYKFKFIKENIKKYNIPNLNDWNMRIHDE